MEPLLPARQGSWNAREGAREFLCGHNLVKRGRPSGNRPRARRKQNLQPLIAPKAPQRTLSLNGQRDSVLEASVDKGRCRVYCLQDNGPRLPGPAVTVGECVHKLMETSLSPTQVFGTPSPGPKFYMHFIAPMGSVFAVRLSMTIYFFRFFVPLFLPT